MRIMPELQKSFEGTSRSITLEQLEDRIVLDGAVADAQDVQDAGTDGGQVDSLGWVYVDNGWWQEDNGSGWWWDQSSGWYWNQNTGWWVQNSGEFSYWYHGLHQYWAQETSTGNWFWWDDISDQTWEPAFTWFADQVNSQWMWAYNDSTGSSYYADELNYFYQDHTDGQWYWQDEVNENGWELAFTWFVDGYGVMVYNDWHSSEYIWGNNFHYIQQHTTHYVNEAPIAMVPGAQNCNENASLKLPAIYVYDVDSLGDEIQVSLSVSHGTLSLASTTGLYFITGDGTQDAQMVFLGSWAELNAVLHDVTYNPDLNYSGSDELSLVVNDLGNAGSGGAQSTSQIVPISILDI